MLDEDGLRSAEASERLIVALDRPSATEALALVDLLSPEVRWFKVGMELFYAEGADLVRELRRRQLPVFLDLKLHDIPNTVASAVRAVCKLDVQMLTLHAAGGAAMLQAAADAVREERQRPLLLGVTVLTSLGAQELEAVGVPADPATQVLRLSRLVMNAGLDGMICSPAELEVLRSELGTVPLLITPGVRPAGAAANDQTRTSTPSEAIRGGASMLVVGRPITQARDPRAAARAILDEIRASATATLPE